MGACYSHTDHNKVHMFIAAMWLFSDLSRLFIFEDLKKKHPRKIIQNCQIKSNQSIQYQI